MTEENSNKDSDFVKLKVIDQHSNELLFRVKVNTELGKVKKNYSERVGVDLGLLRFLFDGVRIKDEDTPKQLNLKDDDVIDVFQLQTAGAQPTEE